MTAAMQAVFATSDASIVLHDRLPGVWCRDTGDMSDAPHLPSLDIQLFH